MSVVLEATPGFIIFFDNQHIEKYVTSFTTSASLTGTASEASIEMIYSEAFMEIPYLTDVRIFSKNVFSSKYRMIFEGQLRSRQVSMNSSGKSILFTAYDNMLWMQKTPIPFMLGVDASADQLVVFQWLAKGMNIEKLNAVITAGSVTFDSMNLETVLKTMFDLIKQGISWHGDSTEADTNSIYHWIDLGSKIKVISDIDARLREDNKLDLFYQGAIIENMYVLLSSIISQLGYELYQDIDALVKIKEPYWGAGVLKPFIIDPMLVTSFTEATNWDNYYSRVLVTGGVDSALANGATSTEALHMYMPAGVYIGGTSDNTYVDLPQVFDPTLEPTTSGVVKDSLTVPTTIREIVVSIAMSQQGKPYNPGDEGPDSFDCSGLVYYALRRAGYSQFSLRTTFDMYPKVVRRTSSTIQPGDLGFSNWENRGPGHVGMYCGVINGSHTWVEASSNSDKVVIWSSATAGGGWSAFGDIISAIEGGYNGVSYIALPVGDGYKPLTVLTDLEKAFGINVYETNQPLIKSVDNLEASDYGSSSQLMHKYSKYLYENLNSAVNVASMNLVSAPWLRLGFNLWFDPCGISRFYYINSISHSGDSSGVYTSLGLTFGRNEAEWAKIYNDRAATSSPTNVFTNVNNIYHSEYVVPESVDPMIILRPGDIEKFKTYFNSIHEFYDDTGSVIAHDSMYRNVYGQHFIRRNTEYLNRWDSEFNVVELFYMMKAMYSPKGTKIVFNGEPTSGPPNPVSYSDRAVSEFARMVVEYDSTYLDVPEIILERVTKLIDIIVAAEKEVSCRYVKTTPNDIYGFNK